MALSTKPGQVHLPCVRVCLATCQPGGIGCSDVCVLRCVLSLCCCCLTSLLLLLLGALSPSPLLLVCACLCCVFCLLATGC